MTTNPRKRSSFDTTTGRSRFTKVLSHQKENTIHTTPRVLTPVSHYNRIHTMKVSVTILKLLVVLGSSTNAFLPFNINHRKIVSTSTSTLYAETAVSDASTATSNSNVKTLGLLTFDLDDTLFPIAQCVKSANGMYLSLNVEEELNLQHLPCHDHVIKICCPGVNIICT